MPPARPRVDDSRSETSASTLTNVKHNTTHNGLLNSKGKKASNTVSSSMIPSSLSRTLAATITAQADTTDPNLPRTNWTTFPTPVLHAYAFAHRLHTPSPYTHPHAELLYRSSRTALRSPSQVAARRRLRDHKASQRRQRREDSMGGIIISRSGIAKGKDKEVLLANRERERSGDRLKHTGAETLPTVVSGAKQNAAVVTSVQQRQSPTSLALAVRRHFNSAQVNEGDAIARFLYVVRHGGNGDGDSELIEGGRGDGKGRVIGSAGRAVGRGLGICGGDGNRDEGGGGCDLGFRLRFRPGT